MQVTLESPDDISATLQGHWPDLPKQVLEALAVEGYRTAALTESQVRRLLRLQSGFDSLSPSQIPESASTLEENAIA